VGDKIGEQLGYRFRTVAGAFEFAIWLEICEAGLTAGVLGGEALGEGGGDE
jgi:hypothetical protein